MRAAIVGGIIAIISLAAYGIVQAGWWPRGGAEPQAAQVQAPQVVAFVPVAPLEDATTPVEVASSSTISPAEAPVAPAVVATEVSANPVVAPAEVTANPVIAAAATAPAALNANPVIAPVA